MRCFFYVNNMYFVLRKLEKQVHLTTFPYGPYFHSTNICGCHFGGNNKNKCILPLFHMDRTSIEQLFADEEAFR